MLSRLLRFLRDFFASPIPPESTSARKDAGLPFKFSPDGDPIHIEFDGIVLTFGTINLGELPFEDVCDRPIEHAHDSDHLQRDTVEMPPTYYRDEDGELRPVRQNSAGLSDMAIEEVAAEFLHARSDADAAPDPLERAITAALRDAYSRELWRRATTYGVDKVEVGGRLYELVPLPAVGHVHLLFIE